MSARNLTWQQVIVCFVLLAAVVAAYKLLGELPAGVLLVLTGIVNLLLGRDPPGPPDAGGGASNDGNARMLNGAGLSRAAAVATLCAACAQPAAGDFASLATKLSQCRAEGRDAGSLAAYERCKAREGITDAGEDAR